MNASAGLIIRYGDSKINKMMFESLQMNFISIHVFFLMGLCGVKHSSKGMSMAILLDIAHKYRLDDVFIEWCDEFSPYKFSTKKNRFVNKNAGVWKLENAFNNPAICDEELLVSEVEKFLDQKRLRGPLDLEVFFEYVEDKVRFLDEAIEKRLKANCIKKGEIFPVNKMAFKDADYDELYLSSKELAGTSSLGESDASNSMAEHQQLIKDYISRNPLPSSLGPMGLPQSKYRHGTFGLNSMEYDAWRRS